jgi:hypothetical protein
MFTHHVFFWLKNKGKVEDEAALLTGLKTLADIELKVNIHIGVPATTDRPVIDSSYDFSLLLIFRDLAEHDSYQIHPIHEAFVKQCSHLWEKVLIYDSVDLA